MRPDDWLLRALPGTMTEDEFFCRFIGIFQSVSDTVLQQIDNLPHAFDPTVAPTAMVREMGRWIGLDWLDETHDDAFQRDLVLSYARLLRARGTRDGLLRLLALISGRPPEGGPPRVTVSDSGGVFRLHDAPRSAPHVDVTMVPSEWASDQDVIRILRDELPAFVTFTLTVGDRRVWPPAQRTATGLGQLEEVR